MYRGTSEVISYGENSSCTVSRAIVFICVRVRVCSWCVVCVSVCVRVRVCVCSCVFVFVCV